jgi:hypothetical protein
MAFLKSGIIVVVSNFPHFTVLLCNTFCLGFMMGGFGFIITRYTISTIRRCSTIVVIMLKKGRNLLSELLDSHL